MKKELHELVSYTRTHEVLIGFRLIPSFSDQNPSGFSGCLAHR
jgi:hypothetical protein